MRGMSGSSESLERRGRSPDAGQQAPEEAGLPRQAWTLLFELMHAHMRNFPALAAEFELSPVQAHVVRQLGEGPLAMSTLANYLSCDASNVTGLVDRMEARGLVERRSSEQDRRVKMLVLTEAGVALRERLLERLAEPPEPIAALSDEDLRALRDIMRRALRSQ
ncbi:MarR family transcriptional regulator [Myxococcus sp. MISCRS1]|uniref:MarR family winged helix-turn-helix transcriptional regulator n=1 Tax=Myxococcus TaxID=32 RepID=UPI001CBF9760|nr:MULTISPECIES: MarR family transcriptional regulator [unclassified Myxococcus]MBZ4396127.1 MarR family transcriptional regulator [Myxococcus sp. AS-1-15]MBZ4408764.1 MarR family transcriptional regulator [Myxococcus sp. XM-1-1-1]MCY1000822.1 MarR family transcriptional regulator [Myxococcus sp. MISCRS1]